MRRRGFTLIELLVVMAIMGIMGTAAVGGYRQMQRGMEERGVINNVNVFVRSAYQRAQIDRQPVAVRFWNECVRSRDLDENEIVIGRAVAVRRYGRITAVQGNYLADEFGDLNLIYPNDTVSDDDQSSASVSSGQTSTRRLYRLNSSSEELTYSTIRDQVAAVSRNEIFLTHSPFSDQSAANDDETGKMDIYCFVKEGTGTATWRVGDAYGFEFATIELPHGFIFGTTAGTSVENPVTEVKTLYFKPTGLAGDCQVDVSAMRAKGLGLTAEKIGTSLNPSNKQN